MSTTTVQGAIASKPSGTVRKSVQATMIYAGNKASSSPITSSLELASNYHSGISNSDRLKSPDTLATIAAGTATGPTFKPYSGGTFKYYPGEVRNTTTGQWGSYYVIFGSSTRLSGVASTAIKFSASDMLRKTANKREYVRTLHQSTWSWTTGQASTATVTKDWAGTVSTDSTDHAAKNPRSVPAELTLLYTGKTPTNKDYTAPTT